MTNKVLTPKPNDKVVNIPIFKEDMIMNKEFITEKDLKNLEDKTDLKMKNISDKIDNKFELVDEKFKTLETSINSMFLNHKNEMLEEERKSSKETRRWIVGTGIAITGLLFTLIKFVI